MEITNQSNKKPRNLDILYTFLKSFQTKSAFSSLLISISVY